MTGRRNSLKQNEADLVQNQHTRELISTWKTLHKHNNDKPVVSLTQHVSIYKKAPLVEFIYLVFTCMPGESYHRQLRSLLLLCLYDVF